MEKQMRKPLFQQFILCCFLLHGVKRISLVWIHISSSSLGLHAWEQRQLLHTSHFEKDQCSFVTNRQFCLFSAGKTLTAFPLSQLITSQQMRLFPWNGSVACLIWRGRKRKVWSLKGKPSAWLSYLSSAVLTLKEGNCFISFSSYS